MSHYYLWRGIDAIVEDALRELKRKSMCDWTLWRRDGLGAVLVADHLPETIPGEEIFQQFNSWNGPLDEYIKKLAAGETVSFRPRGSSMKPKVESGQLVTVAPVSPEEIEKGDIVLCKVGGHHYVHLVTAVQGKRFQISNNHGHVNGWVGHNGIFGRVTKVEA